MLGNLIVWLIIGGLAGWIAGLIVQGSGFGLIGDIVIGIVGALVAGWLLPRAGIHIGTGFIPAVVNAAIGAVILLVMLGLIRRMV
ncbi:MAG: GlsB/YeaQ/YmgE family stress response membrane protein [Methylovirgula sp.]